MTDVDERLLTAAKLHEQVRGDLDGGDPRLLEHTGLVSDRASRSTLSFLDGVDGWRGSALEESVMGTILTDEATEAVRSADATTLSHFVGVTEQDLDGSSLRLPLLLVDALENAGAPAFVTLAGNPNTGKTNSAALLVELRAASLEDLRVVSNVRSWSAVDDVVTSAHDLAVNLLEHRETPKAVVLDEASTHFDARTYRREVAQQYTPLAKRFAKVGVDFFTSICHTGKDLHPEAKRMTTLGVYKSTPETAEFFDEWPADADHPTGRMFGGDVHSLEATATEYDPDDAAPWRWDLEPELFSRDLDWPALLDVLRDRGPSDE